MNIFLSAFKKLFFIAVILELFTSTVRSRAIAYWSYDALFDKSDIVVIAEPTSNTKVVDVLQGEGDPKNFVGVNTEFHVFHVLKGDLKDCKFTVLHFLYPENTAAADGALFVQFRLKGQSYTRHTIHKGVVDQREAIMDTKPCYLLFLKRRADGRYEPITGQYDASLACREIVDVELDESYHEDEK